MTIDPKRVQAVFLMALQLTEPASRWELLNRECGNDAALRQRVEALLSAHSATAGFDIQPSGPAFEATVDAPEVVRPETVIAGRYKLRQQIGEGGMGTVWMADQAEPVKRKVAVKLVRVERGQSKMILARFEAERQAIALMDHPHIAKLLDAGTTETGAPFFVMELVKGIPLNDFCDQHKLTVAERLNLFTQICSAVQHAHQKGIIHRDLKPSNILVESHDGKPVPKVIDFGLAKATGLQLGEHSMFTAFGTVLGTPLYMAPEQANFNAVDIDTRADVYALGVILYELLTGTTPITRETMKKAALDEMLKLIREQEAPTPSSRLSSVESAPSVAASRQMEPAKLGRFVKGELDWIVLKALSKDRERRYESANGFARDIERFLNHEPVTAGPPSTSYRIRKFVRRNRGQVIAASLVLLALVGGVIGTTLGLLEAKNQERKAVEFAGKEKEAKEDAIRNLEFAKKGNELLGSVFAGLDPKKIADSGRPLQDILRENLATAVTELEGSAIGDPIEVASMQDTLGVSLLSLGDAKKAIEVIEKARNTSLEKRGLEHPETLKYMNNLGMSYLDSGNLEKALPLLEETLTQRKAVLGLDHPDTLTTMNNLALGNFISGKLEKAITLFEETLSLRKVKLGSDHSSTLHTMSNLAICYKNTSKMDKALPLYEQVFTAMKAKHGVDHLDTMTSMHNLAAFYKEAGNLDKALPLYEEVLKQRQIKLGPDHPKTLESMNSLAAAFLAKGERDNALRLFEETLKIRKVKLGIDHPSTLLSMNNLAMTYKAMGKLDEAIQTLEETFNLQKAKIGVDHPNTLITMHNLAKGYRDAGKPDKAISLLEETYKLRKNKLGLDNSDTHSTMNELASIYWSLKQLDKSVPMFEQLLLLQEKTFGRLHPSTLTTVANLGVNYLDADRVAEAIPLLEEAYKASNKFPNLHYVGPQLIDAYGTAGKPAEAKKLIDEMLVDARKSLPKDSPQQAGQLASFGLKLLQMKRYTEAEPLLRESLTIREEKEPDDWRTFYTQTMLGGALLGQKKFTGAEPLLLKGYEGMKAREESIPKVPQTAKQLPEALDRLIELYTATDKPDEVTKWQAERAKYPLPTEAASPPEGKK